MSYQKIPLSGSTNGKQVLVVATTGTGTTIHTAGSGTTALDEVWLWANNENSTAVILTIQWGGTTAPDNVMTLTLQPSSGHNLIVPGFVIQNSLAVTAIASVASKVGISGFVNRIT